MCVTHKIILMINIMNVMMGSKDQVLHGYLFHHEKLCKIWISKVDFDLVVFVCVFLFSNIVTNRYLLIYKM
jgi:hypothetical protein